MIKELLDLLSCEDYAAMMKAFNDESSYVIELENRYIAVHFTPDPNRYVEEDRSTYWSAGVLK